MHKTQRTRHTDPRPASFGSRAGFTLLEILVVIVVMALLMGITFRLVKPAEGSKLTAETIKNIQRVNAAISEYHAEYGIYPPATAPVSEDYSGLTYCKKATNPDDQRYAGVSVGHPMPYSFSRRTVKFSFGLTSFLQDRRWSKEVFMEIFNNAGAGEIWDFFGSGSYWYHNGRGLDKPVSAGELYKALEPADRDLNFFKRVKPFLDGVVKDWGDIPPNDKTKSYHYYSVRDNDVWRNDLIYICPPPYTTYALFSAGADGLVVASDPLNREAKCSCGQYHNRDNIYAAVDDRK